MRYTDILKEASVLPAIGALAGLAALGGLAGLATAKDVQRFAATAGYNPLQDPNAPFSIKHPVLSGATTLGIAPMFGAMDVEAEALRRAQDKTDLYRQLVARDAARAAARNAALGNAAITSAIINS